MEEKKQLRKHNNAIFNYFGGMSLRITSLADYVQWVELNYKVNDVSNGKFFEAFAKKFLYHGDEKLQAVIKKNFSEIFTYEGYAWVILSLAWLTSFGNSSENRSLVSKLDKFLQLNVFTTSITLDNFKSFYFKFIRIVSTHCVDDVYGYLNLEVYKQFYNWCYADRIINHFIRERVHAHKFENEKIDLETFFEGEHCYLNNENKIRDRLYDIYRFGPKVAEPVVVVKKDPIIEKTIQSHVEDFQEDFEDDTYADKEKFANII
jgi:hypothetical protein